MTHKKINIVIIAGGIGSRLWPNSNADKPKQFLDILETGKTLIRETVDRFKNTFPLENIYIFTNEAYRELTQENLPELHPQQIICEPQRNNTAPCIAYAAFKFFFQDPQSSLAIFPADHFIADTNAFLKTVEDALSFSQQNNSIVTIGISPTRPDTGYGYIKFQPYTNTLYKVEKFVEKPSLEIAQKYVESNEYLWNAGIFIASAKTLVESYQHLCPDIYTIFYEGKEYYNTEKEKEFIQKKYSQSPNISFDYAIAEKSNTIFTIPCNCGWSDLGTWNSLYEVSPKQEQQNVHNALKYFITQSEGNIIRIKPHKKLVLKGLHDYIIVDTDDALLIYPKNEEQEIKNVSQKFDNYV